MHARAYINSCSGILYIVRVYTQLQDIDFETNMQYTIMYNLMSRKQLFNNHIHSNGSHSHYSAKNKLVLQSCFTIAKRQVILLRVNKYMMKSSPTRTLTMSRPQKRNLL
jgi:hypothetical protein